VRHRCCHEKSDSCLALELPEKNAFFSRLVVARGCTASDTPSGRAECAETPRPIHAYGYLLIGTGDVLGKKRKDLRLAVAAVPTEGTE
jgi:hypothetical protein